MRARIASLPPLYPDIRFSVEIVGKTKGMFNVKAPHCLVFGSEVKDGYIENIGFIGQQMDLFFSEMGLGSCWLGSSKPGENEMSALPFVICMSFGKSAEPLHRAISDFKRKPLAEISEGMDARLEAARLAPSGMNAQNWYFVADNGKHMDGACGGAFVEIPLIQRLSVSEQDDTRDVAIVALDYCVKLRK